MKKTLLLSLSLFIPLLHSQGENVVPPSGYEFREPSLLAGSAEASVSTEYRYGDQPSVKLVFPDRDAAVWFVPEETDWSSYAELEFTLYNPWNEPRHKQISFREGQTETMKRLPGTFPTVPGSVLNVPRESRVTFRIDLNHPELKDLIDWNNITGIRIGGGTLYETTYYLDGFKLLTHAQVKARDNAELTKRLQTAQTRLDTAVKAQPESWDGEVIQRFKELDELAGLLDSNHKIPEDQWQPVVNRALELATVLEALDQGGSTDQPFEALMVSPMNKVFREETLKIEASDREWDGAGHERVSFQVVLAAKEPLRNVTVEAHEIVGLDKPESAIDHANVTVNPVAYVEVKESFYYKSSRKGWWPDPLLKAKPLDIGARVQPFWITVHIPKNQEAGVYSGKLLVKAEGREPHVVEYRLRVWDFSLPKRATLKNLFGFPYQPDEEVIRRQAYDTMLQYRINPVNIYVNRGRYQPARSDLQYCLDRGMNSLVLYHPYNYNENEFPYYFDEDYIDRMVAFLREYETELKELGIWDMSMVLGFDEITHWKGKEYEEKASHGAETIFSVLKKEFPGLSMANIGGPPLVKTLSGPGNIWIPGPHIMNERWKEEYERIRNMEGSEFFFYWVYQDPSFMLDLPGIGPRVCSWIAFKYGASGISYYSTLRAHHHRKALESVDWPHALFNVESTRKSGRNGDGTMVYTAQDGTILPSIRLANTRDGIQDYEYLVRLRELAEESGDTEALRLLALPDELLTWESYPKDPATLSSWRRQLAEAIERLQQK